MWMFMGINQGVGFSLKKFLQFVVEGSRRFFFSGFYLGSFCSCVRNGVQGLILGELFLEVKLILVLIFFIFLQCRKSFSDFQEFIKKSFRGVLDLGKEYNGVRVKYKYRKLIKSEFQFLGKRVDGYEEGRFCGFWFFRLGCRGIFMAVWGEGFYDRLEK